MVTERALCRIERSKIEAAGYKIIADVGDHQSDLQGFRVYFSAHLSFVERNHPASTAACTLMAFGDRNLAPFFPFAVRSQKVEMVHQCERLNREDCCNVGVANGQQVVPVVLLPLYVRSLDNNEELPLWLQAINYIDCREGE
jgi:hypothetical protein